VACPLSVCMFNKTPAGSMCALALCAGLLAGGSRGPMAAPGPAVEPERVEAARLMARALVGIKALRQDLDLPIDPALDPNGTGIIGAEFTPLTTSLGEVDAKRTSANPAFAAALVRYFRAAGLASGDLVAVGGSGSFPALLLASLCASRALDLEPIVIYSVGASMYGANLPGFTFADMLERLRRDGVLPYRLAAISPGGDEDAGGGVLLDEGGRTLLDETRRTAVRVVQGGSLTERIADRLRIYGEASAGRPIRCFVNVGGSDASWGNTEASLSVRNGLVATWPAMPTSPTRGLVFEFAERGVRVVHLLFVRGLARENGLPFDPVPLPPIGEGDVYSSR
jgi:poly-gamma-glutamate system protein